jgi:hypothetical protein
MIEHYGRIIVVNGDVLPVEDYYDGIDDTEDGKTIDRIISGINPRSEYTHGDVRALAQGALFLLDKDQSAEAIRSSVEQHPSAQNESDERVSTVAEGIIQGYDLELERLRQLKKTVDVSVARRDVFIAVIRNLEQLSEYDLERIAVIMGYEKNHFSPKNQSMIEGDATRARDWRERQHKD